MPSNNDMWRSIICQAQHKRDVKDNCAKRIMPIKKFYSVAATIFLGHVIKFCAVFHCSREEWLSHCYFKDN